MTGPRPGVRPSYAALMRGAMSSCQSISPYSRAKEPAGEAVPCLMVAGEGRASLGALGAAKVRRYGCGHVLLFLCGATAARRWRR